MCSASQRLQKSVLDEEGSFTNNQVAFVRIAFGPSNSAWLESQPYCMLLTLTLSCQISPPDLLNILFLLTFTLPGHPP